MSTAAVTYTFAANTLVQASQANTNFQDVVDFLNSDVIHKDASIAFTAIPSGPSDDPTSDDQFARKAYVDMCCGVIYKNGSYASVSSATEITGTSTLVDRGVAIASDNITIEEAGVYVIIATFGVQTNTTGRRGIMVRKNGSGWKGDGGDAENTSGFGKRVTVVAMDSLIVGDVFDYTWYQNSGSTLTGDSMLGLFKIVGTS